MLKVPHSHRQLLLHIMNEQSCVRKLTIGTGVRGDLALIVPTTGGTTATGALSAENPALMLPDPLSMTTATGASFAGITSAVFTRSASRSTGMSCAHSLRCECVGQGAKVKLHIWSRARANAAAYGGVRLGRISALFSLISYGV